MVTGYTTRMTILVLRHNLLFTNLPPLHQLKCLLASFRLFSVPVCTADHQTCFSPPLALVQAVGLTRPSTFQFVCGFITGVDWARYCAIISGTPDFLVRKFGEQVHLSPVTRCGSSEPAPATGIEREKFYFDRGTKKSARKLRFDNGRVAIAKTETS